MEPVLSDFGDFVVVTKFNTRFKSYQRNDVIIARSPIDPSMTEGDLIETTNQFGCPITIRIPKGHVWIEGDNKKYSRDSRNYGPLPYALLEGKVVFKARYATNKSVFSFPEAVKQ